MERFKETELSRMRAEESRKCREQLDNQIHLYEIKYNQRVQQLKEREEQLDKLHQSKQRVS